MPTIYISTTATTDPGIHIDIDADGHLDDASAGGYAHRRLLIAVRILMRHGQVDPDGQCTRCCQPAPCGGTVQGARMVLTYAGQVLNVDPPTRVAQTDGAQPEIRGRRPEAVEEIDHGSSSAR